MNKEVSLSTILSGWQKELSFLYPVSEIAAMFRIALEDILDLSRHAQLTQWESPQPEETITLLEKMLDRLKTGEPLQHIIGFTYFDDLKIMVSTAVLIPRPETEELVYEVVKSLPKDFSGTIIDWCTGSGCIALALKKHFLSATVFGYDISVEALDIARKNAVLLGLDVLFLQKDALSEVQAGEKIDVIISNPPYIPKSELVSMHKNVTDFEPSLALFVPDNSPLLFYEAITAFAAKNLHSAGHLFFELHENYAEPAAKMVEATQSFGKVEIIRDLQNKDRFLKTTKS